MRLRRRRTPPEGGPHYFGVRTRLAKSVGIDKRYKLSAIRALPTTKKDTVVLQATDGTQAVCLITLGQMNSPRLIPSGVLPKRKEAKGVMIDLADDQWRSSEGTSVPEEYRSESDYPPIVDVLPKFSSQSNTQPLQLGIDLSLLSKVAESLGTTKLTLLVPVATKPDEVFVNKPIAICPATDESKVRGVGVLMPLSPTNGVPFYMKVRRLVAAAEARYKPKARTRSAKPQPV